MSGIVGCLLISLVVSVNNSFRIFSSAFILLFSNRFSG